jgi:hypothetical protein
MRMVGPTLALLVSVRTVARDKVHGFQGFSVWASCPGRAIAAR